MGQLTTQLCEVEKKVAHSPSFLLYSKFQKLHFILFSIWYPPQGSNFSFEKKKEKAKVNKYIRVMIGFKFIYLHQKEGIMLVYIIEYPSYDRIYITYLPCFPHILLMNARKMISIANPANDPIIIANVFTPP